MKKLTALGIILAAFAAVGMEAVAQLRPGKSRLATTQQIMSGFVHPNQLAIEKFAQKPLNDAKSWAVTRRCSMKPATSSWRTVAALMPTGRKPVRNCEREVRRCWQKLRREMRRGSQANTRR